MSTILCIERLKPHQYVLFFSTNINRCGSLLYLIIVFFFFLVSTQLSHSESQISLKSEIPQDCQVRKLPKSLLKFVAVEMDGDSWEDLVELYGWNYDQTRKFASSHPNDVFLALLKVAPFQTYTLSQLRADLERLPRLDLLCDLDEKISGHNTEARGAS